jgi:hypothetical protein
MTVAAGRFSALGAFAPGESVNVFNTGTTTLATLYADKISGTTVANPVTADELGDLGFFAVPGDYDLNAPTGTVDRTVTVSVRFDPSQAWTG